MGSGAVRATEEVVICSARHTLVTAWGPLKQDELTVAAVGEFPAAATRLADRAGDK